MWLLFYLLTMDAVKEMKEWLFQKLQASNSPLVPEPKNPRSTCAITPGNIPEFVIPGSDDSSRRTSLNSGEHETHCSLELKRNSYGGRSIHSTPPGSPARMSPSDSVPCMRMLRGNGQCNSAPVTPKHEMRDIMGCRTVNSGDGTNDDPLSFAAMSLPHFRAQTSFGFSTLSENPHTKRRESLFHTSNAPLLKKKHSLKLLRQESLSRVHDHSSPDITTLLSGDLLNCTITRPASSSMPSVVVTSFPQSSRSGTPSPEIGVPPFLSHRRLSPTYQGFTGMHNIPIPTKYNRFYNRRRSSLVSVNNNSESDISSVSGRSTPSQHSVDLTHEPHRHSSLGEIVLPVPSPCLKRHSDPQITEQNQVHLTLREDKQKPRSSSCHVISKANPANHNQLFAPYGELKFSFQYLAASKQLKLTLLKAENIGGQQKQEKYVNPFAKAYLMPGKIQKQSSTLMKRTKNPVFNQEMYFHNISLEDLHAMTLRIKIFSKPHNLKLQEFIGEVSIPFDGFDVLVENRMWKDLESGRAKEELGYLGVGLLYDDVSSSVRVYIDRARQLPQHPITGPPDPYVRVEVSQAGRSTQKKQTSTQKKEANPIFEETFNFTIAPTPDDLSATTITLTIFDHERIRSDDVIGNVILGCMATDVSQYGHWQEVLENPGETISKWHYLIDTDD